MLLIIFINIKEGLNITFYFYRAGVYIFGGTANYLLNGIQLWTIKGIIKY